MNNVQFVFYILLLIVCLVVHIKLINRHKITMKETFLLCLSSIGGACVGLGWGIIIQGMILLYLTICAKNFLGN